MAAPTVAAVTDPPAFVTVTGEDLTVNFPSGTPAAGTLVIAVLESSDGSTTASGVGTVNSPSGWQRLHNDALSGVTGASAIDVWAWLADGSASSVQFEGTLKNHICAGLLEITDHGVSDVTTDIVVGTGANVNGSATLTIPGVAADADSLIVLLTAYTDDQLDSDSVTSWTNSNLTITERFDEATNVGTGGGVAAATAPYSAGGATGSTDALHDTTSQFLGVVIAIPPASTGISGSGTASSGALAASGSGEVLVEGSGTVGDALEALGSGSVLVDGSGTPGLAALAAAGSGSVLVEGSGTPGLAALAAAGSGSVTNATIDGSGAAQLAPLQASGSGGPVVEGSGSADLKALDALGSGSVLVEGTGSAALRALESAGAGGPVVEGSGAANVAPAAAQGSGDPIVEGSGAAQTAPLQVQGSSDQTASGDGAATLGKMSAQGAGGPVVDGSGAAGFAPLAVQGDGLVIIDGSGVVDIAAAEALGAGAVLVEGAGAVQLAAMAAAGASGGFATLYAYPAEPRWETEAGIRWGIGPAETRWEVDT